MPVTAPTRPFDASSIPPQSVELALCAQSFRYFLRYWRFKNRETGELLRFIEVSEYVDEIARGGIVRDLWEGQSDFIEVMRKYRWIFALKAGKLGFTELECAYDAWVARFRQENARVHIFSRNLLAARELLGYVKFGIRHLPTWFNIFTPRDLAGANTTTTFIFRCNENPDDVRTIISYATTGAVAIDQSATHSHVDELSHMGDDEGVWNSISTTVPEDGTIHIVSRGAGDAVYSAVIWHAVEQAPEHLWGQPGFPYPFFSPFNKRPPTATRDKALLEQAGTMTLAGLNYFLPETAEDALMGDETSPFIPIELWDSLVDPDMPPLLPGDRTPVVMALDAAVTQDCFAIVLASLHPDQGCTDHTAASCRGRDLAIRGVRAWKPQDFGGRIDFRGVEQYIRFICRGGHITQADGRQVFHPKPRRESEKRYVDMENCADCKANSWPVPPLNVVQITYDPYQLEETTQDLVRDGIAWCSEFDQGTPRLEADGAMKARAYRRGVAHNGNAELREHVNNARAKVSKDEDTKMRIVKKAEARKIDLTVAASMALYKVAEMYL